MRRRTEHSAATRSFRIVLGRLAATGALVVAVAIGMASPAHAQGVTTAAIRGTITREGGTPVDGAIITLINVPKGTRLRTSSAASGRYSFENVESGGPYTLEITAIGYEKTSKTGVLLTLGQRSIQDFQIKAQVVVLQELEITATTDPLINSAKTGPQTTVSDSSIARTPILGRNWGGLLQASPQVVGNSIAGQNNRYNTVQIAWDVTLDAGEIGVERSSSDDRVLAITRRNISAPSGRPNPDMEVVSFADGTVTPFLNSSAPEQHAEFSPDGKWMAFVISDASGIGNVYVRGYPGGGALRKVSTAGGVEPHWTRNGWEIVYLDFGGKVTAVDVSPEGDALILGNPRAFFDRPVAQVPDALTFDAAADGNRFVMLVEQAQQASTLKRTYVTIVFNFLEELRRATAGAAK